MTIFDWFASDQGSNVVLTLVGLATALTLYVKARTTTAQIAAVKSQTQGIHVLVNGESTRKQTRIVQLEETLRAHGVEIPANINPEPNPVPEYPKLIEGGAA